MSLDGYIALHDHQNSMEWTSDADKQFFVKKTKESGVMIMGRSTYETIGRSLPGRRIIVMTRSPDAYENIPGKVEFVSNTPEKILEQLRGYEEVIIAGGESVYTAFLDSGLVTDLFLTIEPILFGGGVKLYEGSMKKLVYISSEKIGSQALLVHYTYEA